MLIKLFFKNNEIKELKVPEDENNIFVSTDSPVIEFLFKNLRSPEDSKNSIFRDLEKQLKAYFPFTDIIKVQILNNNSEVCYEKNNPIKAIYLRTFYYSRGKILTCEECLSIRFFPEMIVDYDYEKNSLYCNEECPFLNKENNTCTNFFNKKLAETINGKKIVLIECYLENDENIKTSERYNRYHEMTRQINKIGHIPYEE